MIQARNIDLSTFSWHLVDAKKVENVTSAKVDIDVANPFGIKVIASVEPRGGNGWCDVRAYDSSNTLLQNTRSFIELDGSTIKSNQNIIGSPCAVAPMTQYYSSQIEATSVRPSSGGWRSWNFHASNGLSTFVGGSRQNSNTGVGAVSIVTQYSSNIYLEVWVRQAS